MKCTAQTAKGQPCRAQAIKGSTFCFTHDPAQDAARTKARKRGGERRRVAHGGEASTVPTHPRNPSESRAILDFILAEVIPMENSIQRARVLIALSDAYLKAFEIAEMEDRVKALEQELLKKC